MASGANPQPADPYKHKNVDSDVPMEDKMKDLFDFVDKNKFCMMTTQTPDGLLASRCMALAGKEDNGTTLLFHTNTHSGKLADIDAHPVVNLAFLSSTHGEWASISGKASIATHKPFDPADAAAAGGTAQPQSPSQAHHSSTEQDREDIRKYYSPALRAWVGDLGDGVHDGGPNDPRIGLIKIKAHTAQYALHRKGVLGRAVEVAKGVASGEAAGVNLLRSVNEVEMREWADAET